MNERLRRQQRSEALQRALDVAAAQERGGLHTARERALERLEITQEIAEAGSERTTALAFANERLDRILQLAPRALELGMSAVELADVSGVSRQTLHSRLGGRLVKKQGPVHTAHRDGRWVNQVEGSTRVSSTHSTKEQAIARGRKLAQNKRADHIVHNSDGTIASRNSYGNDPYPPRG
jgi:hypothetical protein